MRLALACGSCLMMATAAQAAPDADPKQGAPATQRNDAANAWSLRQLTGPVDPRQRMISPSQLDDLMNVLPLLPERRVGGEEKGFSFRLKPGKGVKAVARLRF